MPRDGGDKKKKKKKTTTTTAAATTTADTCKEDEKQESYGWCRARSSRSLPSRAVKCPQTCHIACSEKAPRMGGPMCRSAAAEEEGPPQSDALAVGWYRKAADQGHPSAQFQLGCMYQQGRGTLPQSDALAVEWYRRAADQGYAPAQCSLGWMYEVSE